MTKEHQQSEHQHKARPNEPGLAARLVFREVNDCLRDLAHAFAPTSQMLQLVCECGHDDCIDRFSITRGEYERVRGRRSRFAVKLGHEQDCESVTERHHEYLVVEEGREAST